MSLFDLILWLSDKQKKIFSLCKTVFNVFVWRKIVLRRTLKIFESEPKTL